MNRSEPMRQVITAEQVQKRVKELGRQISDDYKGQTIQMLAVLENAFMFLADLVRAIDVPVGVPFKNPGYNRSAGGSPERHYGDLLQPRAGDQGAAHLAGGGAGAFGYHQRVPDERFAVTGCGIGEAGDPAGQAVRTARSLATGLFWISGRRYFSYRVRVGRRGADEPKSALPGGGKRKKLSYLSDKYIKKPFRRRKCRIKRL